MEIQLGPNSLDEPNLLYKLQRKIKVFNTNNALPNRGYNLVSSSSKYGIVFIATPEGILSVYYLRELIDGECEPKHLDVKLQEKPTHIAVSCDQELLAVTGGQLLSVYSLAAFQNANVSPALTIKCDVNTSTFVSALQWNPCIPDVIAVAFYDGTLLILQIATSQVKKVPSKARCICWSPKGKQLVTGNSDGTLSQYKPDLTLAKMIPPPNLFSGSPVEALAIYWISTFQFAVVYKNATDNSRPAVTIINAPKAGQPSCLNYEDICYSMCSNRPWYYYLLGIAQWNMILSSSSNSMEIATLGSADGASWLQWCQPDEARPELPLTDKKQENYPVGICIDTCAIHQLPWGENSTLPYMPVLHVVSHSGLLTIFNVINLNNGAAQICSPPQQLTLPAAAMTSVIPGVVPAQPALLPTPSPIAQPKPVSALPAHVAPVVHSQFPPPSSQFGAITTTPPKPVSFAPPTSVQQQPQGFTAAAPIPSIKKPVVTVPTPAPQLETAVVQPAAPVVPKSQPPTQIQENAALKAEQERINEMKANEELKNILMKEVNDFQMELYKFMTKTIETQKKLQHEIESFNAEFNLNSLNTEQLRKDCCLDDLRNSIVHLKLELVRACAVVAEARTHAEAKDYNQWTQADPLTTKRVASVKKLAYYLQTQLDQAQKALDYRWCEVISSDSKYTKSGQHMIRPILDDVYRPLVNQQEILSRQQAVLRTLRNTLNDCDVTPMFKSSSLLRSTPFRNKDPLSKLTKNILNMSIDSSTKSKEPLLSAQKLDALRDMLSNHKTVKIKPVNVEMRQHLAAMKQNYEKSMKEKAQPITQVTVKIEAKSSQVKPALQPQNIISIPKVQPKVESKQEQKLSVSSAINVPSFSPTSSITPVSGLTKVTRTLFTDEPKPESQRLTVQQVQQQPTKPLQTAFCYPTTTAPTTSDTRSIVKELLLSKQTYAVAKNDANTLMGQPICSPSSFAFSTHSSATTAAAPSAVFTSKPISEISNMFNKLQPQAVIPEPKPQPFVQEVKPQVFAPPKPSETAEPEATVTKQITIKPKTTKPLTNLFAMKPSSPLINAPLTSTTNVPDVLKSTQDLGTDKIVKPQKELSKENIADKVDNIKIAQKSADDNKEFKSPNENKELAKPIAIQATNKTGVFATTQPVVPSVSATVTVSTEVQNQAIVKTEAESKTKPSEKTASPPSNVSSIFASANASVPAVLEPQATDSQKVPSSPVTSKLETPTIESSDAVSKSPLFSTTPSAASIFGAAVASQPNTTSQSQAGSIFAAAAGSSPPAFGGTQGSIFGTASTTSSTFETSATQSVFSVATTKPSVFSTPTPSSPTSVFGAATTQSGSTFGSEVAPASTAFAPKTTPQPSAESVFGSSTTSVFAVSSSSPSSPTTSPIFGSATSTTQPSVFGGAPTNLSSAFTPTATTTTQSIFGSTPTSSVFSNPAALVFGAANKQNSLFGAPSTQVSVFDTATPSTQASVFGSPTNQASIFGSAPSTQASVFGSAPTTQASVFGTTPATTAQSGSLFGGTEMNLFASASISTTSAPSQSSGGSIFGGGSTGSVFGSSNANVFGGKTTFGQPNPSAAAIFGGVSTNSFEHKPAANFWSGGNTNRETFGPSAFGQQATTQASSIFGGGSGGSFTSPSPAGQAFGNPQQNSAFGSGDNQSSVFGSPQQASAFGGSTVFGSKPVFGQSGAFGSPPSGGFGGGFGGFNKSPGGSFGAPATFGGSAAFGTGTGFGGSSPSKMFGNPTQTGFGTTQSNATFESLATQNTLTFGNLAQQSGQQQQAAPAFNASPSFTGWRG